LVEKIVEAAQFHHLVAGTRSRSVRRARVFSLFCDLLRVVVPDRGLDLGLLVIRAWSEGMVLKLTSDEVGEARRALSAAHSDVLRELSRVGGFLSPEPGLELCRRKWKLEGMLRRLDQPADPPVPLELVSTSRRRGAFELEAA
jgi:hypothetical protein